MGRGASLDVLRRDALAERARHEAALDAAAAPVRIGGDKAFGEQSARQPAVETAVGRQLHVLRELHDPGRDHPDRGDILSRAVPAQHCIVVRVHGPCVQPQAQQLLERQPRRARLAAGQQLRERDAHAPRRRIAALRSLRACRLSETRYFVGDYARFFVAISSGVKSVRRGAGARASTSPG